MRAVVQRVKNASVEIENSVTASINKGMVVLVGGQLIVEHLYSYQVPVSVFITVGGGLYFLYLLLTQKKV